MVASSRRPKSGVSRQDANSAGGNNGPAALNVRWLYEALLDAVMASDDESPAEGLELPAGHC